MSDSEHFNVDSYEWQAPPAGPPVEISLDFEEAWDVVVDGLVNQATLGPLTSDRFAELAEDIIHLLIDASEDAEDEEFGD